MMYVMDAPPTQPDPSIHPSIHPPTPTNNKQIEEQNKILAARRSNNLLDTTKFVKALPDVHIPEIHEACEGVREKIRRREGGGLTALGVDVVAGRMSFLG